MTRAIVRGLPNSFANALSAVAPEPPISVALARQQHRAYCDALGELGASLTVLPADEASPDCVFVEDTAVIAGGVALITRPGAPSRQAEPGIVAAALAAHLEIARMAAPATLDGGDCMRLGTTIYVGRSARTNDAGISRLAQVFATRGLRVVPVELPAGVLHLKCVVSPLGADRVLLAEGSLDPGLFPHPVIVPAAETYAANAVAIGSRVIVAEGFPRTLEVLSAAGFTPHPVPTSEVRKADGSLTCQSLIW